MDALLSEIKSISSTSTDEKGLIKMEKALLSFKSLLPEKLEENEIQNIESALFSLFKIKNGIFAPHSAIFIAKCLVPLYQLEKSHRFWNLITLATDTPTPANIFATGYVVKKNWPRFKVFFIKSCTTVNNSQRAFSLSCIIHTKAYV